jgi:hypothetical protein
VQAATTGFAVFLEFFTKYKTRGTTSQGYSWSGGAGAHPRSGDNGLSAPTLFPHLLGKGGGGGNNTILAVCGDAKYPHMVGTQLESVASSCSQPRETQEKTDPAAHSATPRQQVHDPDRRALLPGLGHRPAPLLANGGADWTPPSSSASQWWGGMGTALIPSGPIVTWPGARAAPQPGGEAGGRPLAPPHSPLRLPVPNHVDALGDGGVVRLREAAGATIAACSLGRDPLTRPKSPRPDCPCFCRGRAHGDPGALPQLRGMQLLAPASGPVHPERASSQNPKDSSQR